MGGLVTEGSSAKIVLYRGLGTSDVSPPETDTVVNAMSTAADVAIDGVADGATTTTPFVVVIVAFAATVPVIIVDAALGLVA